VNTDKISLTPSLNATHTHFLSSSETVTISHQTCVRWALPLLHSVTYVNSTLTFSLSICVEPALPPGWTV